MYTYVELMDRLGSVVVSAEIIFKHDHVVHMLELKNSYEKKNQHLMK